MVSSVLLTMNAVSSLYLTFFSSPPPTLFQMPRYYIHETFRLFLVLLFFYQIWFQMWFAVSLVLTLGYGYPEHRVKRNVSHRAGPADARTHKRTHGFIDGRTEARTGA